MKKLPEVSNGNGDDACVKEKRIFLLKKKTLLCFSFRQCPSNQQHHFAVWCFGHHATSWGVASVSPFTQQIKESIKEMFSSLIYFYLFFLYISFGTFFGQGIAPASPRGVKQNNQNMESDIYGNTALPLASDLQSLQTPQVHRRTSLMCSSFLPQPCPTCLVHRIWMVFEIGGRWNYLVIFYAFCKAVWIGVIQRGNMQNILLRWDTKPYE